MHVWRDIHLGIYVIITSFASQIMVYFFLWKYNVYYKVFISMIFGTFHKNFLLSIFLLFMECIFFSFPFIISVERWLIEATLDNDSPSLGLFCCFCCFLLLYFFIDLAILYRWSFVYSMKHFVFFRLVHRFCYTQMHSEKTVVLVEFSLTLSLPGLSVKLSAFMCITPSP